MFWDTPPIIMRISLPDLSGGVASSWDGEERRGDGEMGRLGDGGDARSFSELKKY